MKEKFDVFILAGQSNAEGRGIGSAVQEYVPTNQIFELCAKVNVVDTEHSKYILYPDLSFVLEEAKEKISEEGEMLGSLALFFAKEYIEKGYLKKGRKVLIIQSALSATGFAKGHWGEKDILYLKMLQMVDYALSLNHENRIKGLLWHQGEHEVVHENKKSVFHNQLKTLYENVRKRYECPELPIIAGDFCHEWKEKNLEICNPIVNEIKEVIKEIGNAAFVESNGLLSNNQTVGNGDDIHFCKESLRILGKRYFEKYQHLQ